MPVTINGTTGIAGPDGSASTPAVQGTDSNTGLFYPAADTVALSTGGSERLRITSAGFVGIGTSSPAVPLDVVAQTSASIARFRGRSSDNIATLEWYDNTNATRYTYISSGPSSSSFWNQANTPMAFGTNDTERMRIDSSGNVGIGVTPSYKLHVNGVTYADNFRVPNTAGFFYDIAGQNGLYIYGTTHGSIPNTLSLNTNGSERMRIDSSGNVLIGTTTSPSGSGNISINNGIYSVGVYNNSSGQAANLGIDATNKNFYRSTSSIKYKREVQDAVHGLSELLRLRPVTYKGKSPTDGERVFGGLIAEEVHDAGLTEFVQYSITNEPDALAYGNMVSLCVKAIQELKAIVDAQAARISALEAA